MRCIKCDGQLQRRIIEQIEVDRCNHCSGIWFDIGELNKVLEAGIIEGLKNDIDNNQGHDQQKGACPRCEGAGQMVQVASLKNPSVHIDTCSVCYGQWLDGGELEELDDQGVLDKIKSLFA